MPEIVKAAGVTVEKPWYMSKKLWLTAIALGVAAYQAYTGKHEDLTPEQIVDKIVTTATWLGPLLTAVLGIAHVDAKSRFAAILSAAIKTAAELEKKDANASTVVPPPS